jgi:mannonate dehydratase
LQEFKIEGSFYESHHLEGNVNKYEAVKAIVKTEKKNNGNLPMHPDHQQMIDDLKKNKS